MARDVNSRISLRGWVVLSALLAFGLGALGVARSARADLELYSPSHRPAEELLEIASGLLEGSGSAVADPGTNKLLLRGPRPALEAALRALRALDVPLPSYRIESLSLSLGEISGLGLEIEDWVASGGWRVGRSRGGDETLRLRLQARRGLTGERVRGELRVREGQAAELWTGQTIPVDVEVFRERGEETRVFTTPRLVTVRTGFRVRARRRGPERLDVEIEPVVSDLRAGGIQHTAAAARISARPGEWLVVARVSGASGGTVLETPGLFEISSQTADTAILLRVTPVDPAAP